MSSKEVELQNTRPALSGGRYFFSGAYPEFPADSQPFLAPVRGCQIMYGVPSSTRDISQSHPKGHKLTYFTNKLI